MSKKTVLVIDDESALRLMIRAVMEGAGWKVIEAPNGLKGLELLDKNRASVNVVLLDVRMPVLDGQATLLRIQEMNPSLPVVMLTAFGTVGAAVEAMKRGAFDYLTKPADNDELVGVLEKAYQYSVLLHENMRQKQDHGSHSAVAELVGTSKLMQELHELIYQVAPSEATVLIMGESGTGKELVAEALHQASHRAEKTLVKVNCAALPAQLLESELFGYKKGAFTGAVKDKPGRFSLADAGTIFLDEIGELPLEIQAKLLRVIQERVLEPLGGINPEPVDVRIICATNRRLLDEVRAGRFREDLYFRLNVLELNLPPLRDRLDDLPILTSSILGRLCKKNHKEIRGVGQDFLEALAAYSWPGNIRELGNVLERSLILSRSDLLRADILPPYILQASSHNLAEMVLGSGSNNYSSQPAESHFFADSSEASSFQAKPSDLKTQDQVIDSTQAGIPEFEGSASNINDLENEQLLSPLEIAEYRALLAALKKHGGHRERTAQALGISRRTLQYKLRKFGLARQY